MPPPIVQSHLSFCNVAHKTKSVYFAKLIVWIGDANGIYLAETKNNARDDQV